MRSINYTRTCMRCKEEKKPREFTPRCKICNKCKAKEPIKPKIDKICRTDRLIDKMNQGSTIMYQRIRTNDNERKNKIVRKNWESILAEIKEKCKI